MASKMIGRTACPECDFESAHVKESEKCVYRYCPECGSQHHARTPRQRADLLKKTRLIDTQAPAPAPEAKPADPPKPAPVPTPQPKARPALHQL